VYSGHYNSSHSSFLCSPCLAPLCLPFITVIHVRYLLTRHQYVCLILRQCEVRFINFPRHDQILQHRLDEGANIHIRSQVDKGLCFNMTIGNQFHLRNIHAV
jgi:hypothetical protein